MGFNDEDEEEIEEPTLKPISQFEINKEALKPTISNSSQITLETVIKAPIAPIPLAVHPHVPEIIETNDDAFVIEKFADDYFEPSYFTDVLKIDPEKIAAFQYYCVEDSRFMKAVKAKNKTQATFWINDLAVQFNLLQKSDIFEK